MESFERAHIIKKNSKTDLTKKKLIRQMLSGYNQNNNDLIKHSEVLDDASSSVSGFSDLNLTASTDTDKTGTGPNNDDYCVDLNSLSSLPEAADFNSITDRVSEYNGFPKSAFEATMPSDTESVGSRESDSMQLIVFEKKIEKKSSNFNENEVKEVVRRKNKKKKINKPEDSAASPQYVSITANDMLDESFESLVGNYRHSTVKNLPWDSHNFDSPFNHSYEYNNLNSDSIVNVKVGMEITSDDSVDNVEELDTMSEEATDNVAVTSVDELDTMSEEACDDNIADDSIPEKQSFVEPMDAIEINPVRAYHGTKTVILVLKHQKEIYLQGKVEVTCLAGSAEIFGYLLQDKPVEVYAPNYSYAHCLKTVKKENIYYGLFGKLTASGLTVAEAEEIVTSVGEFDCVIRLKSLNNSKLSFIEDNFTADIFSKNSKNNCLMEASQILGCSLYLSKPLRCFREDPKWHEVLEYAHERSRGIVCGGKGIGKSTFLRYYTNRLLANGPVLVIDLDVGQAEFTVAGNVSATVVTQPLIGPAFTHLKRPEVSYNLGMINTMDTPKRYLAAVDALITYCSNNEYFQNMPWIVNTMGMVNGLGLKFIAYIILRLSPTFLLQLDSNIAKKQFECHLKSEAIIRLKHRLFQNLDCPNDFGYEFVLAPSVDSSLKINPLAPKDERYLNFLAYFAEMIKPFYHNGLLGITPYIVSLHAVNVALNVWVDKGSLGKVLCGKIVALCEEKTCKGKVFTLSDKPIPCHGHGLIRGIDTVKSELYIVTPVPVDLLGKVNTIVYADWVPELRGQEKYLPEGITVPYRTHTEYQQRQLMFPPRRRFNPIQLLKMSRNS